MIIQSCYFLFKDNGMSYGLSGTIIDLSLEWSIYVNGVLMIGYMDHDVNVVIPEHLERAFSYKNVNRIFNELKAKL